MNACKVAAALGDYHGAAQYAKATLRQWHNPVKQYFARLRLGGLSSVQESVAKEEDQESY